MKITKPARTEIDVRRPNGIVETKDVTKTFSRLTDFLFQKIVAATRAGGGGEVLRYRNIPAETEAEESDYEGACERCRGPIDTRTAFSQMENVWRGARGRVYYCAACSHLLHSIGAGEHTEMDERAGARPDMTPETKSDY